MRVLVSFVSGVLATAILDGDPPNILYLMADDMRPQMGSYGQSYMQTPHLDGLSASGLQFDFAYSNFAFCAPSRNSIFSGRRPDRTRCPNFLCTFRQAPGGEDWTALPEFFKKQGYFTSNAGKLFHDGMDDPQSWSYPSNQTQFLYTCQEGDLADPYGNYCGVTSDSTVQWTDEDLVLQEGFSRLSAAHASGKPWFVSMGFHRPHWAYRVPQGFHGPDLYPTGPADVVRPPMHPEAADRVPWMAGNWEEGTPWTEEACCDFKDPDHGCPECVVPEDRALEYRRWYYAAVTWVDHCIGQALAKLQELGVADKTIVLFHSDHGYQLGEQNEWTKKSNTELAVHVPLLIRVPWKSRSVGRRTTVKAELVDMYRTLAELAGLDGVEASVQGSSLAPVFDDPLALGAKIAYSQIPRCGCHGGYTRNATECALDSCSGTAMDSKDFNFMGYTMRTGQWRYTAWVPWDHTMQLADWSRLDGEGAKELYDLQEDTGHDFDFAGYARNLAGEPAYSQVLADLQSTLLAAADTWGPIPEKVAV